MTALTFFTATLYYPAITADVAKDPDITPQTFGISASVLIDPFIQYPPPYAEGQITAKNIMAATLTPTPAMLILAPVKARLDAGKLMLRADPDLPVYSYPNLAAFPATGVTTRLYRATDTAKVYAWQTSAYVEVDPYAPVQLVAKTAVLALPAEAVLGYEFSFSSVTYNGKDQELPSFCIQAPTTSATVDLAVAPRISRR